MFRLAALWLPGCIIFFYSLHHMRYSCYDTPVSPSLPACTQPEFPAYKKTVRTDAAFCCCLSLPTAAYRCLSLPITAYRCLSLPIAICFAQPLADYFHCCLVSSGPVSGGGREGPHRSGGARAIGGAVYTGEAVVMALIAAAAHALSRAIGGAVYTGEAVVMAQGRQGNRPGGISC